MLLIGSGALYYEGIGDLPRDVDIIATYNEFEDWCKHKELRAVYPISEGKKFVAKLRESDDGGNEIFEFEIAWPDSSAAKLLQIIADNKLVTSQFNEMDVAPLNVLYTLKMSHRYLRNSPHFHKTMCDIKTMRDHSATIPKCLQEWFAEREAETYNYGHPSLNQSKSKFFDTSIGVTYLYDHDSIHEAVKIGERPAYTYFKKDQEDVYCDKEKFFTQPPVVQANSVLEESYVLAIERCLLHYSDVSPRDAFRIALMKVCTSISSGWWREFAWENYGVIFELAEMSNFDYYSCFKQAVENNKVLPFDPATQY